MQVLNSADSVPEILAKEDIDPTKIVYHGDLKGKGKDNLEGFAASLDKGMGYKKDLKDK